MDFLKKESTSDSTECFSRRAPLGEKNTQNISFASQIQELMAILVQKKSELKEAKLKHSNLLGKQEQQQVRISKIKIGMDHEIQKEQIARAHQDRLQEQINACKQSIKELTKSIKTFKNQLGEVLEDIIAGKKTKLQLESVCAELDCLNQGKSAENNKIEEQIQNLETLIITSQNDIRSKQDELTQLRLQETEMCSLLGYLEQKITVALRAKNSCQAQNNEVGQEISRCEQKIQNLKRQTSQVDWSCEQIRSQNSQIEELNRRLINDLEGVQKHLAMMEKMNQALNSSIAEYGLTGTKVTRMINAVKNHSN